MFNSAANNCKMSDLELMLILCALFSLGNGYQQQKQQCPNTCFCDFKISLISCSGQEGNKTLPVTLLRPDSVDDIHLVQRLDYRDLPVRHLESDHVRHFVLLTEFSMVRCGVADIENATFVNNRQMERIDLSQNLLAKLNQVGSQTPVFNT